jgi:hypothetical protein
MQLIELMAVLNTSIAGRGLVFQLYPFTGVIPYSVDKQCHFNVDFVLIDVCCSCTLSVVTVINDRRCIYKI